MNIIEHLTRTVTPIVLGNLQGNQVGDRPSLLEKVYAIMHEAMPEKYPSLY